MENRVRKFAKEARARLINNNYDKPQKKVPSGRVFKMAIDPKETDLFFKVCEMEKEDTIVTNPLGQLIDSVLFSSLDDTKRNRYVFKLSQKYIDMLERCRHQVDQNMTYASVLCD